MHLRHSHIYINDTANYTLSSVTWCFAYAFNNFMILQFFLFEIKWMEDEGMILKKRKEDRFRKANTT